MPAAPAKLPSFIDALVKSPLIHSRLHMATQAWLPANSLPRGLHGDDPYLLVDIVSDSGSRTTVRLPDGSTATVDTSGLSPPVSEEATDMAMLLHMSEATVLDNLLKRYKAAEPYTYTGEILMSVNPCERLEKLHWPRRCARTRAACSAATAHLISTRSRRRPTAFSSRRGRIRAWSSPE